MTRHDYTTPVNGYLKFIGVTFQAVAIGNDCPMYCEHKGKHAEKLGVYPRKVHIHGKHYAGIFNRTAKSLSVDFWNSYADEEHNNVPKDTRLEEWRRTTNKRTPTAYDVLSCLTWDIDADFAAWCSDYGYDTDSRKAYATFEACNEQARQARLFFSPSEIEQLRELAQ